MILLAAFCTLCLSSPMVNRKADNNTFAEAEAAEDTPEADVIEESNSDVVADSDSGNIVGADVFEQVDVIAEAPIIAEADVADLNVTGLEAVGREGRTLPILDEIFCFVAPDCCFDLTCPSHPCC